MLKAHINRWQLIRHWPELEPLFHSRSCISQSCMPPSYPSSFCSRGPETEQAALPNEEIVKLAELVKLDELMYLDKLVNLDELVQLIDNIVTRLERQR